MRLFKIQRAPIICEKICIYYISTGVAGSVVANELRLE
jgi:hypothetical protein